MQEPDGGNSVCTAIGGTYNTLNQYILQTSKGYPMFVGVEVQNMTHATIPDECQYIWDTMFSHYAKNTKTSILYYDGTAVDTPVNQSLLAASNHSSDSSSSISSQIAAGKSITFKTSHFSTYVIGSWTNSFKDVASNSWYYNAVEFAVVNGMFKGTTDTTFEPSTSTTRAMVWTVLASISGQDVVGGDTWYANAQKWAMDNGISDGTNPNGNITREQLAVMLTNYMKIMNVTVPTSQSSSSFKDQSSISSWAVDAVSAMKAAGVISGRDNGSFDPQGVATHAEAATMLMNFRKILAN